MPDANSWEGWSTNFSASTALNSTIDHIQDALAGGIGAVGGAMIGRTVGMAIGSFGGPGGAIIGGYVGSVLAKDAMDIFQGFQNGTYSAVAVSSMSHPAMSYRGVSDTGESKWLVEGVNVAYNPNGAAQAFFRMDGNSSANALTADKGNDFLNGGAGGDWLKGQGGNDRIFGDSGWDRMAGGDGNDRIEDGTGDDYMHGGSGVDTFVFTADTTHDVVDDFQINYDHVSGFGTVASYKTESEYFRTTGTQYWVETVTDKDGDVIRFENATHFGSMGKMDTLAEVQALVTDWLN